MMSEPASDGCYVCAHIEGPEPRAEEILAAAGEGIYGLNLRGQVTFMNPTAGELTGHSLGELLGPGPARRGFEAGHPTTGLLGF